MLKIILTIVAILVGSLVIIKVFQSLKIYEKWAKFNMLRLIVFSFALLVFLFVFVIYTIGSNKGMSKSDTINLIKHLDQHEIDSIEFYTYSEPRAYKIVADTFTIINKTYLSDITSELKELVYDEDLFSNVIWTASFKIYLEEKLLDDILFDLFIYENNECVIWVERITWFGDFYLGEYRNDNLLLVLKGESIQKNSR